MSKREDYCLRLLDYQGRIELIDGARTKRKIGWSIKPSEIKSS